MTTLRLLVLSAALAGLQPLTAGASDGETARAVGEVSLVLGEAVILSGGESRVNAARGMVISVGDEIETRSNGHVHIRFVDDALVSVRPNSRLNIDRYEFDANRPELSAVKFSLLEGVTRAISGEAAKVARDRFRLNTPVAAIGVRGTDFVVGAVEGTTRAQVNEGAIVIAPFSDACSIEAFGPCLTNALELTGDTLQLAALAADESVPRRLPPQNVRRPDFLQEEVKIALASAIRASAPSETQVQPESSGALVGVSAEQSDNAQVLLESSTNPLVQSAESIVAQPVTPPDFTPPIPLTPSEIGKRQLVWGYYAKTPLETNRIALSRNQATEGRSVTIGNMDYGLYRTDEGTSRPRQDLGIIGFQLDSAQAAYNSDTGIVAMAVRDGNLDINFQDNTFNTALILDHVLTGQVDFAATGRLFDGGFFRALEATQKVSGAVSFDGSEAGYLFERQLENGLVTGLTLWGSK